MPEFREDRDIFVASVLTLAPVSQAEKSMFEALAGRLYDLGVRPGEALEYVRTFEEVTPPRTEGEALAMRYTIASRIVKRIAEELQVRVEVLPQVKP